MYTLPISESQAIAIDDQEEDPWYVYEIDYEKQSITPHEIQGVGQVESAFYDPERGLLWVVSEGDIFGISLTKQDTFGVPMPEPDFHMYAAIGDANALYVCGEYSNIWRLSLPDLSWTSLQSPDPKPARSDDPDQQTRQVRAYANAFPPFYNAFRVGASYVFCGALGALAQVKDGVVRRSDINTGARFVSGRAEGGRMSLSADSPGGQIYIGDFDTGFEALFADKQPSLHRTAIHGGQRFIGIAEYPPSQLHNLYVLESPEELVPYNTDCAREPFALIDLTSIGKSLWAIDAAGVFRRDGTAWVLIQLDDLQRGIWPTAP